MATYTLISSNVLTASAASVIFSSIPATYTDLVLRISVRDTSSTSYPNQVMVKVNAILSYSKISLEGYGNSTLSQSANHNGYYLDYAATSSSQTSNTFASSELYIPNYTNSTNYKPASGRVASPENGTTNSVDSATAMLMINNAAVSSLTLTGNGTDFVSGSSFYLYGISNA
jgi:hypothetical protein